MGLFESLFRRGATPSPMAAAVRDTLYGDMGLDKWLGPAASALIR